MAASNSGIDVCFKYTVLYAYYINDNLIVKLLNKNIVNII